MKTPAFLRSLGPSIIVASIVLGPGSILTSSKVGCQYGYGMLWALVGAVVLMIGMTALSAYLGVLYRRTLCGELAHRVSRPAAVAMGVIVFLIIAGFQSSNNVAVLASLEGLTSSVADASEPGEAEGFSAGVKILLLCVLNGIIIATMYGFRRLYRPLERLMMILVMAMLVAFTINLVYAQPSLTGVAWGLVPRLAVAETGGTEPAAASGAVPKHVWALFGLIATTFSIAGAYYQSYLVREKGWTVSEVRKGLWDSVAGIAVLGLVSSIIMITSAAALHGKVPYEELNSAGDIARQLEPFFGPSATVLFSFGIFAAAFSSFLGNALVGGTVLADGLGLGSSMDDVWPKRLTVAALLAGMGVAVNTAVTGANVINVIVFAQALTVLGGPALALLMLWLGYSALKENSKAIPWWVVIIATCGGLVALALAVRTVLNLL